LLGTGLLAALLLLRARFLPVPVQTQTPLADVIDDIVERAPTRYSWVPYFLAFLTLAIICAQMTGWRFLLFPPLAVIGFEMFAHPRICPWAERPLILPLACTLSATGGVIALSLLGAGPLAAAASMACGIVILKLFDLHVPPALAVGLLPFIIEDPSPWFPVAVGVGTLLLTVSFLLWRKVMVRR
jgi:hypothetical protein